MSLSYGFFNSYNGDRVYNAEQFSSFLDGIVYDGVYQAVGNKFFVRAAPGLMVTIDTGRAWFDHTWILNNTLMTLALPVADTVYPRIDAVVIEVNHENRENYIKIVEGTAKVNSMRPTLVKNDFVKQWALAYVTIPANATSISQSNIVNVVDTAETPLASALALAGIPSGGKIGQVLAKKSSESGAVDWYDVFDLPKTKWYLPTGISESQVVAAYLFGGVADESTALRNVNNGTAYALAKSGNPVWSSQKGYQIQGTTGLMNDALAGTWENWQTVIICYSDVDVSIEKPCYLINPYLSNKAIGASANDGSDNGPYYNTPGFKLNDDGTKYFRCGEAYSEGVLACDFLNKKIYMNGISLSVTSVGVDRFGMYGSGYIAGGQANGGTERYTKDDHKPAYIYAISIYNTALSSDQIRSLSDELRRMRGFS